MYITPAEVVANVKNLSNQGTVNDTLLETFISAGAEEINSALESIYEMPLPPVPEGGEDPYPRARQTLKTLLLYYCMVRLELFLNIKAGFDEFMWQSVTNRRAYEKMYREKLERLMKLVEKLPGVPGKQLVESSFPKSKFKDYNEGYNW